ncbi:chemotaxis protein CheB [Chitinibacter sp. S2-10]|uniref:chemotaxis protein CheB n=1 Tax=Chitinibacter sp. S2-10 TaxID=3373597 RepID=UPI003977C288
MNSFSRIDSVRAASSGIAANSQTQNMHERLDAPKLTADAILAAPKPHERIPPTERIVAIGTSAGGTKALEVVLPGLKKTCPGIVIVQHMPEKFTAAFAMRLNQLSAIEIREARDRDLVTPGLALIAPGGKHLLVRRNGLKYYVNVVNGPMVCRHRPSVDVLFRSMACAAGRNGVGYILTGMGDDGARGMREMFDAGAQTFAQNEASCVVFGMPKEAVRMGGVRDQLPLERVADSINRLYAL